MAKTAALALGVVFVIVGILGWIPNPVVGMGALFDTNHAHDLVHIIIGAILVAVSLMFEASSALALKVFGVVYLLVAVLGFVMTPNGGELLGLVQTNTADHVLHIILGIVLLGLGFTLKGGSSMSSVGTQTGMPGGM